MTATEQQKLVEFLVLVDAHRKAKNDPGIFANTEHNAIAIALAEIEAATELDEKLRQYEKPACPSYPYIEHLKKYLGYTGGPFGSLE